MDGLTMYKMHVFQQPCNVVNCKILFNSTCILLAGLKQLDCMLFNITNLVIPTINVFQKKGEEKN